MLEQALALALQRDRPRAAGRHRRRSRRRSCPRRRRGWSRGVGDARGLAAAAQPDTAAPGRAGHGARRGRRGVRAAAHALHRRGFQVAVRGTGTVRADHPAAGELGRALGTRRHRLGRVSDRAPDRRCSTRSRASGPAAWQRRRRLPAVTGDHRRQPARSRRAMVYVAVRGSQADGHDSWPTRSRGARRRSWWSRPTAAGVPEIVVRDGRRAALVARRAPGTAIRAGSLHAGRHHRHQRQDHHHRAGPPPASMPHGTAGSIGTLGAFDGAGRAGAIHRRLAHHARPGRPAGDARGAASSAA